MKQAFIAALLLCTACGSADPVSAGTAKSLFPLALGNRWEFLVSEAGKADTTKIQTVSSTASVDGHAAFVLISENATKGNRTESIQYMEGTKLVRAFEESWDDGELEERARYTPAALRLDTALLPLGTTYEAVHLEEHLDANGIVIPPATSKDETFFVEAVDESVTVPAGTFTAVRIRREVVGGSTKTYWYVAGVGKIKEVGGQTESLVSSDVSEE